MVVAQHVRSLWSCWASPHTSQEVLWRLWLLAAVEEAIPVLVRLGLIDAKAGLGLAGKNAK